MEKEKTSLLEKLVPVLLIASIGLAFAVGILWQKVNGLQGSDKNEDQKVVAGDVRPTDSPEDLAEKVAEVTNEDHIKGDLDAKVFLIEYSDYQCSYCKTFHTTAQQVYDEYDGQVAWVYRHFPLDSIHPLARSAAVASECIATLGGNEAFWKFTDAVLAGGGDLSNLESLAVKAGVNSSAFKECLDKGEYEDDVEKDYQSGLAAGVNGTPGNIILNSNGEAWSIPGALPFAQLKTIIDQALGE